MSLSTISPHSNKKTIWTIGHSTRSFEEFLKILSHFRIQCVADVRNFPGSRKFPHFNQDFLERALPEHNIEYLHIKKLGGRRKPNPESKNTAWRNPSFRAYADYMQTEDFHDGLSLLKKTAAEKHTAYMCSEAVWWRCHRAMISDELKAEGWEVYHILNESKEVEHPYTQPAKIIAGKLSYEE